MRVIIITPEKLMELLQKQQQITMDNGWSSDPLKAFAHPPLPEAVEVPGKVLIDALSIAYTSDPMQQEGYVKGFYDCLTALNIKK